VTGIDSQFPVTAFISHNRKMNATLAVIIRAAAVFLLITSSSTLLVANVSPDNTERTEIVSLVVRAEMQANEWNNSETVCLWFEERGADTNLVNALRQKDLNVFGEGSSCDFAVYISLTKFDSGRTTVHSYVLDMREARRGNTDRALLRRDGDYTLAKAASKWSIRKYEVRFPKPSLK
jgi:hypothetical protein